MKKTVFCVLILLSLVSISKAAFPVKYPAVAATVETPATTPEQVKTTTITHENTSVVARVKSRLHTILFGDGNGPWEEHGEGARAMFWAYFGLFIWPLGILAVVHGARGLNSRSGPEQDRATIGLIFGIGEVIATVAVILWFLLFF